MSLRSILLFAISFLLLTLVCQAADSVTCPATITTRQELTSQVAGWTKMSDEAPHNLAGITFYDGPPSEKASLVYDKITKAKGEETAIWNFDPKNERKAWIACSYAGTAIELTRTLPPHTTMCSVVYNSQEQIAGLPVIKKITCK
ncbi:MAG TPA: STY0301 family protein [Terriglobales bacterium]|nr:STY0301 family protein [Terriglobales bacterium]